MGGRRAEKNKIGKSKIATSLMRVRVCGSGVATWVVPFRKFSDGSCYWDGGVVPVLYASCLAGSIYNAADFC